MVKLWKINEFFYRFLATLEDAFSYFYYVEIGSLLFAQTFTLYAITYVSRIFFIKKPTKSKFQQTFLQGYLIIPVAASQIFIPCALSSLLVMKGEEFYLALIDVSWYLLSQENQKAFQMLIIASQDLREMSAGNVTINLPLFIEVSKISLF